MTLLLVAIKDKELVDENETARACCRVEKECCGLKVMRKRIVSIQDEPHLLYIHEAYLLDPSPRLSHPCSVRSTYIRRWPFSFLSLNKRCFVARSDALAVLKVFEVDRKEGERKRLVRASTPFLRDETSNSSLDG
jgi:hypothetical protein